MKKKYKLVFTCLFISLLLPNLAFASWWNPISWFAKEQSTQNTTIVSTSTLPYYSNIKFNLFKTSTWFKTNKSETIKENTASTTNDYNKLIEQKK